MRSQDEQREIVPSGSAPVLPLSFAPESGHRLGLICEALESRQLLSTITTSAPDPSQITAQPNLQVVPLVSPGPTGLTPQQISNAYGVNQIKFSGGKIVGNGSGQTIAIVTAYNDPNISSDLAAFDNQFGLSAPPSLTVKNLGGDHDRCRLGAGDLARRRVGSRPRPRGQHPAGRGGFEQPDRPVQRGQLRQQAAGRQRRLDELGHERVLGSVEL